MRHCLAQRVMSILLTQAVLFPAISSAQQQSREESRPRRVSPEWKAPPSITEAVSTARRIALTAEPKIRVALATNVRSATVSTTGRLMNATGSGTTMIALDTSRVRVEPRVVSPLPAAVDFFQLNVAGPSSREEAAESQREIKKIIGEDSQITFDTQAKSWGLLVGERLSREEAEEFRAELEDAGFDASVSRLNAPKDPPPQPIPETAVDSTNDRPDSLSQTNVRLTAHTLVPTREVVATASVGRLFSSSQPVSFASDSEISSPVRFNDRPYRGRIEVFANARGSLTVVNELGLEDYVRGVVANELSPGGYPAIEALKAQAIAARTYALKNRGQFSALGFDVLPTTRSQVYRGLTSENPLASRAVDETRGVVATYNGEPINALYTSTCGGRTEDSENIFNEAVPYLRGRECAAEGQAALTPFTLRSSRETAEVHESENVPLARDVALLAVENFASLRIRVTDSWLSATAQVSEVRSWLGTAAILAHQIAPVVTEDNLRPPGFATALNAAIYGESRGATLLNNADADYYLATRDSGEVPLANRADLALLLRDGFFSPYPDATLRPQQALSRARVLHTIARLLEARNLLHVQKGTARPALGGQLVLRSPKGKDQPVKVGADAFLFRQIGQDLYPVSSVVLVGGESVTFHVGTNGEIDCLEVRPAPNGAAAERFSPFTNWTRQLSLGQIQARLGRAARGIGSITDLQVLTRGSSRRVTDLEVIGQNGIAHVRGGRIRSTLGLREHLFVIDRRYDDSGRIIGFTFTGRGWGHGVGMCQVGAYGLARQGLTSEQILKTYYTGIELTRLY